MPVEEEEEEELEPQRNKNPNLNLLTPEDYHNLKNMSLADQGFKTTNEIKAAKTQKKEGLKQIHQKLVLRKKKKENQKMEAYHE